ncbi:MAG: thioredoxin family protein [Actinomycetia bacterium]|nr:thioredoxin family protein [Actinomycetes bacterium]
MIPSWTAVIAVLFVASGLALVLVRLWNWRARPPRPTTETPDVDTGLLELSQTGPTIVHFSAAGCGPCVAVRRVVEQVCANQPTVAHVEIDMDINPVATQMLSVLSLPTTFVFDADGKQRYRASGVPRTADLQSALEPLLT